MTVTTFELVYYQRILIFRTREFLLEVCKSTELFINDPKEPITFYVRLQLTVRGKILKQIF
jgi:hypothetical protein